ncbi:MAG: hypothetical protein HY314_06945 [Acidobacteria bacterium]|nr:hypothetical protein [Acidobacteriota bacterium]
MARRALTESFPQQAVCWRSLFKFTFLRLPTAEGFGGDEKVMGTVHIAIGDNVSFGGQVHVSSHLDGLLKKPTLEIDGHIIMRDGQLLA